jgi:hypothetical protein
MEGAREELLRIASEAGGIISPRKIVEIARDEENPLHDYFLWNDTIAAERYRLNQASLLIRKIKIDIVRPIAGTKEIEIKPIRQFSSPARLRDKNGDGSYVRIEDIMNDNELKADLLETAKKELIALKVKYENLSELSKVWEAIETL